MECLQVCTILKRSKKGIEEEGLPTQETLNKNALVRKHTKIVTHYPKKRQLRKLKAYFPRKRKE